MGRTEHLLTKALEQLQGVQGNILTCIVLRRGLTRSNIRLWCKKLRAAADILEEMDR